MLSRLKQSKTISAQEFLQEAYHQLDYSAGLGFYVPADRPTSISKDDMVEKFGWLKLAAELKADRIFFVNNYPVVLFFKLSAIDENEIRELHIKVWNMSRAPFFFIALPGELRLYSAYQKPIRDLEKWKGEQRWLRRVEDITQVAEALKDFSRAEVESERAFRSVERQKRADEWLLRNLRLLRKQLQDLDLPPNHTLNLIGRSIFIRYLEDRKVLLDGYFAEVTNGRAKRYIDVLRSHTDTYNLFKRLRQDFNGNMFPLSVEEEQTIEPKHLDLLMRFLSGETLNEQQELFFWAYKFDVIPIELISSIYEEFYHALEEHDSYGTHYTPPVLVDFVLSETLTTQKLESGTVLDLACGSGIFLVEAFRRIAHYRMGQQKRKLRPKELVKLLKDRIFGVDIDGAAVRVAAFSLYLALLDFMEPSDIREHQLPLLFHESDQGDNLNGYNLFTANSFWLTPNEKQMVEGRLQQNRYSGRARDERVAKWPLLPLGGHKFDLVVGNPPWGTSHLDLNNKWAGIWCDTFGFPVGDDELSQCFIWRARSLLTQGGEIGFLVSSGVFFKHSRTSRDFRQRLLSTNRINAVYNFAHVRRDFFNSAISPFAAIFLTPTNNPEDALGNRVVYASAKQSRFVENLQAVVLDKSDIHRISQRQLLERETIWKTLLWGGMQDVELLANIEMNRPLEELAGVYGQGYTEKGPSKQKYHSSQLQVTKELPTEAFTRKITSKELKPIKPRYLYRLGVLDLYRGPRLLIKRGITEQGIDYAEIQATLVNQPFAFRNSIHGVRLDGISEEERKVILGCIQSSLALYYHFLTCSTWGFWHHEIHLDEHLHLPIRLPKDKHSLQTISQLVDRLSISKLNNPTFFEPKVESRKALQSALDEAIFELYELSEEQRDLVNDFCQITLEFFYRGLSSDAIKSPTLTELQDYTIAFLDVWRDRLRPKNKELEAHIYAPMGNLLIGASFELKKLGTSQSITPRTDNAEWRQLFHRLSKVLPGRLSQEIYLNRTVKILDGSSMFVVKRAERRFWTKSQARQDAHELLTEVFKAEWEQGR